MNLFHLVSKFITVALNEKQIFVSIFTKSPARLGLLEQRAH